MDKNIIVLDLETKKTFEDIGQYQGGYDQLGVSFAGVYSYSQDKYFGFYEHELGNFEKILAEEKPTVVGFNTVSFDLPVLQPYMPSLPLLELPQVDILVDIHEALGHRVKLDTVALATLGVGKSGSGLDAIRYYREKNFEALSKYCFDDVRITKELFDYGKRHGRVYYTNAGVATPVDMPWGDSQSIEDKIKEAVEKHKELSLTVLRIGGPDDPTQYNTTFEPHKLDGVFCWGYSHTAQKQVRLETRLILNAEETGNQIVHQTSLI